MSPLIIIDKRRLIEPSWEVLLMALTSSVLIPLFLYLVICRTWKSKLTLFPLLTTLYIHVILGSVEPRMIEITHVMIILFVLSISLPHWKWNTFKVVSISLHLWLLIRANHCDFYGRGLQVSFTSSSSINGVLLGSHPISVGSWNPTMLHHNVTIVDKGDGCQCNTTEAKKQSNNVFVLISTTGCSIARKVDIVHRYNFSGIIWALPHHTPLPRVKYNMTMFAIDEIRRHAFHNEQTWTVLIKNDFSIECFLVVGLFMTYIVIK